MGQILYNFYIQNFFILIYVNYTISMLWTNSTDNLTFTLQWFSIDGNSYSNTLHGLLKVNALVWYLLRKQYM